MSDNVKPHAAAVRAQRKWFGPGPDGETLSGIVTHEYEPLTKKVKQAIEDIRYTQSLTGNGRIANYLEAALKEVIG